MVRIKICGITNWEDAELSVKLGVDALGFVFAKSPRKITPQKAFRIIKNLPPFVFTVGVFVNEDLKKIKRIVKFCRLNAVQLHGEEDPLFCKRIREFTKVIKAFRIKDERDLDNLINYEVDGYLLDTYTEEAYGGTGKTFDWELAIRAKKILGGRPLILSGGLNPKNVSEAIRKINPFAVDVSSGVESFPGKKSKLLLTKFIKSVKNIP